MENPDEDRPFLRSNPVAGANLDPIQNRKVVKPPLKIKDFERAFPVLDQYERAWWRTHDSLGLTDGRREPPADRSRLRPALIRIPGTKTEESECYMPMSPPLQAELKTYLATRNDDSPYLFPGRSAQTKGKKIYSRRRLLKKSNESPRSAPTWKRTRVRQP